MNSFKTLFIALLFTGIIVCSYAVDTVASLRTTRGDVSAVAVADADENLLSIRNKVAVNTLHGGGTSVTPALAVDYSAGDCTMVEGACTVYQIIVRGVSDGDYAYIYDGAGASRGSADGINLMFEVVVDGVQTVVLDFPFGVKFNYDVGVEVTDADVFVSVVYGN